MKSGYLEIYDKYCKCRATSIYVTTSRNLAIKVDDNNNLYDQSSKFQKNIFQY